MSITSAILNFIILVQTVLLVWAWKSSRSADGNYKTHMGMAGFTLHMCQGDPEPVWWKFCTHVHTNPGMVAVQVIYMGNNAILTNVERLGVFHALDDFVKVVQSEHTSNELG